MSQLKERVPKRFRTPVGIMSYLVGLVGFTIGYIFFMLGIILYFDLAFDGQVTTADSLIVFVTGVVIFVIGYFGVRGYMYFSY